MKIGLCILISSLFLIHMVFSLPTSFFHDQSQHKETKGNKQLNGKKLSPITTTVVPPTTVKSAAAASETASPTVVVKSKDSNLKIHQQGLSKRNNDFSKHHSEQLYSELPGAEFRHFKKDDSDRRRRSSPSSRFQFNSLSYPMNDRSKRDLPNKFDDEDALALLALWASGASPHRIRYGDSAEYRYDIPDIPSEDDILEEEFQQHPVEQDQISDGGWVGGEDEYGIGDRLNVMRRAGPVLLPILPNYSRRNVDLGWGNNDYEPSAYKRFMVTKRSRPSQIPQDGDIYSFAQLLSDKNYQPAPSAYRRYY